MGRLYTKLIYIFFSILFLSNVNAKNPPPGTGTSDLPANIFILLDNSGSMSIQTDRANALDGPVDVNVDNNGNVYILEYQRDRITKYDSSGTLLKRFGQTGNGCNQWRGAFQFDISDGYIYVADTYNNRIVKLDLEGNCVLARFTHGFRAAIRGIAVGAGYVWAGGASGDGKITSYRTGDLSWTGNIYSNEAAGSDWIWGMSYHNNSVGYVNAGERRVKVAKRYGHQLIGDNNPYSSNFVTRCSPPNPTDVAFDSSGNVYVTSRSDHRIRKIANMTACSETRIVGGWGQGSSQFRYPYGIEIDSSDKMYVTDYRNQAWKKFDLNGTLELEVGGGGTRLAAAKKVIRKIVSNTDLTSGAYFGLMEWGTRHRIRVNIGPNGASRIFNNVNGIRARGGTDLRRALNIIRNHFNNGNVPDWKQTCANNYLIVISDGRWVNHSGVRAIARQLAQGTTDSDGNKVGVIKTFAVGFNINTGAQGNYNDLAQDGGTTTPLYADNEAQLLAKLTDAIKQAISGRLTFTTPAVMSDVQRNNFVYQSTFEYEENIQWKGSIKKYKLLDNGKFGPVEWDAAKKLQDRTAERKIWTSGISATGLNNFTTANRDELKSQIFTNSTPTDTEVDNLINFIRGIDTYDQDADTLTNDSIHKLADIYHSNLVIVGPPEASTTANTNLNFDKSDINYRLQNNYNTFKGGASCGGACATRTEVLYAGANNGILHAFKTSDGEEEWGFIPPMVLANLEKIPSSKANATNPIYGVDGSPVVKDIYFDDTPNDTVDNPRWRTILISGLGAGGKGIFALDVTDVKNPKQIFAINNNSIDKTITHWSNDGVSQIYSYAGGNIPAELDYRKLGETWSTPRIIRMKISGKEKWVAVFGAGYNGGVNPDVGSAVFIMDIENEGKLLKVIDIEDQANVFHNYVFGFPQNNTEKEFMLANYGLQSYNTAAAKPRLSGHGGIAYSITGDENGDIINNLKLTFDTPPQGNIMVSLVNITDIVNSVPADISLITADGSSKANYFGAMAYVSDLEGKVTKINLTDQGTLYEKTTLFNAQSTSLNGRYIYTRPVMTINDSNLWLYFGTGNTQHLQEQSSQIQNRVYGIKDTDFPNFAQVNPAIDISKCKTSPTCPGNADKGWYVNLPNKQKLSAEPTIDKNRVYFPIYEPALGVRKCEQGDAILTAYDTKCGNSVLNINLGKGVLSKVVVQGDNLYIGIAGTPKDNIGDGFTATGNIITGKSKATGGTGTVQTQYWREID